MDKNPLISVILPTYNVAKYLPQCLSCIESQSYRNIEVFVVVDGATDGSSDIAQRFCESHDRFHYIYQENSGSGTARNRGIEASNGDYLCFIDPDDWVDFDYIEQLVLEQQKENYDYVVVGGVSSYEDDKGNIFAEKKDSCQRESLIGVERVCSEFNRLFQSNLLDAPHHKLYKKEIVSKYNVRFPNLRRSQDIVFNLSYLKNVESVCISPYAGYHYRSFVGPRKFVTKDNYIVAVTKIYEKICELVEYWCLTDSPENICYRFAHNLIYLTYWNVNELKSLFDDPVFRILLKDGHPKTVHMKIVRFLMLSRCFYTLKKYFQFVEWLKLKNYG